MPSRSLPRWLLVAAGIVLAALLGLAAMGYLTTERRGPDPTPSGDFDPADFVRGRPKLDAPFVATDYEVVDAMLALAGVKPRDYVIDLGSGDGRILIAAARSHGARGLGIEIDPARIREAEANARAAHVNDRVQFRRQDLFRTPLRDADVLTLYLTQEVNLRLRDRILSQMRPGSRVVSHEFNMGDWRPDQRQRIGNANIYLWVVPAQLEGRWTLTGGGHHATLDLQQSYQRLDGRATPDGSASGNRVEQGVVNGDRVRFVANIGEGRRAFEGRVVGDRIEPLQPGGAARSGEGAWQAVRAR